MNKSFSAEEYMQGLEKNLAEVRAVTDFVPEIAIVLGSGLGGFAANIKTEAVISYRELTGFPISTVPGHEGRFVFGTIGKAKVVCMQGRIHYYEGYDMSQVVMPTRLMHLMGARKLILTNAVGGMNPAFNVGDFMLVRDHIASFVPSPLVGENIPELGERFTDMTSIYTPSIREEAKTIARENDIILHEGVFLQTTGPQYESPAEIKMYRLLGADTVGMSTAVEAIAARHMGMQICAINCVTNKAAGMGDEKLSDDDVKKVAGQRGEAFSLLIAKLAQAIAE